MKKKSKGLPFTAHYLVGTEALVFRKVATATEIYFDCTEAFATELLAAIKAKKVRVL